MAIINPLSTTNAQIDIKSGTGDINLGTDAAAKDITIGSSTGASSLTLNTGSGGLNIPSFTTTGALVSDASGAITDADASTAGYVLTSNGSGSVPSFQARLPVLNWNTVTTTTAMAVNSAYITNSASQVSLSLPATSAVGDMISIQGLGSGGWIVTQGSGQQIFVGSVGTTFGATGTMASDNQYDCITIVCVTANALWLSYGAPLSAGLNLN